MGIVNTTLRNLGVKKEISIKQQITIEKNKIYDNRDKIYDNIVKSEYNDCYCGCKYNQDFTRVKQTNVKDYTLIVEGNIDIIYNEITEDDICKNICENIKKNDIIYLNNLLILNHIINENIIYGFRLSIYSNKIGILYSDYKNLIIIKDSDIKKLPIVINKKDEKLLRSKGFIGNVIQECLTAKKLVLESSIYTSNDKDSKKRKRITVQIDTLPNKKVNVFKSRNEIDILIYLKNKFRYTYVCDCICSCTSNITYKIAGESIILVEGYRKKIIDKFIEFLNCMHYIYKKQDKPELLHIIYYEEGKSIDIMRGSHIIDYYTYIDDEIIPVVIKIKDENKLRKMGLIGNVIKDSMCSRLLLKNL